MLESARSSVAVHFGARDAEHVIFTSCGTESINAAFCLLGGRRVAQLVISTVEHSAVSQSAARWADGRAVRHVPVSSQGVLDLDQLAFCLEGTPSLVSVTMANNETGVITDIQAVAQVCRSHGALLHVDAVQAAGKIPLRFDEMDCDAASLSAHKFHGPPGCGMLFLRPSALRDAGGHTLLSGHQERGLRGGTENLPAAVGTAVAVEALRAGESTWVIITDLRNRLEQSLVTSIPGSAVHGVGVPRLPNTISLFCPDRNAADLVLLLSQLGVATSSGAACTTGGAPSHVIQAMGFSRDRANSTLRLSLSRFTTAEEVDKAACLAAQAYRRSLASASCS